MPQMDLETQALLKRVRRSRKDRGDRLADPIPQAGDRVACAGCGEPLTVSAKQAVLLRRYTPEIDTLGRHPTPPRRLYHNVTCQSRWKRTYLAEAYRIARAKFTG